MAQLNVSLPDGLKERVDRAVASGSYSSPSDYVRDLIRRDAERQEKLAWLQAEIDKGIASGIDPRPIEQIFHDIRAEYLPNLD